MSSFLVFALFFGVFEFIRGSILTGFPWNLIAYSFVNHLEILSITIIDIGIKNLKFWSKVKDIDIQYKLDKK